MIKAFNINNFRSIKKANLSLGKITVLTGANNSGKSSFIYSLLALKNTMANPNQTIDGCLTLPFINLGGFKETVFNKNEKENIELEVLIEEGDINISYKLSLGKILSFIEIKNNLPFKGRIEINFPYTANKFEIQHFQFEKGNNTDISFKWNGFSIGDGSMVVTQNSSRSIDEDLTGKIVSQIFKTIQKPIKELVEVDFVPIRRGFTKPFFTIVPLSTQITNEDEYATLLANDRDLASKVSHYIEKIVDRNFSVFTTPGTAIFNLQTIDRKTGFLSDLVNEGLGTNQLVTILAKILQKNNKFICIDEPEIHLHPTIIDKLVSVLIEISENENKQFLVSTHSEHFINSLLKNVVEKKINHDDVKVYYLTKNKMETKADLQEINEDGQIKGGMKNFYENELNNMKTFFKITD